MPTVYKLVNRRQDGKLTSAAVRARGLLRLYKVGRVTKAPDGLKLLAFRSLPAAARFQNDMIYPHHYELWEAKGENPQPQPLLLIYPWGLTRGEVKEFWHGRSRADTRTEAPRDTVACDSITLIKRVYNGSQK